MVVPPPTLTNADGGIVSELQSRHGHSAQPESQQVLAVLQAVLEVIAAQGMSATPTTIFAALMSALERPDAQQSPVTALAMCTVLSTTLTRVPNGVLRSKLVGSLQLLSSVVEHNRQQAAACKAGLLCLGQVLCAADPAGWAASAAAPAFRLLLSFSTDSRPKLRKRAAGSVADVLGALQDSPAALAAASEVVVALCKSVLPGPAAAQRAAAAASNKQRPAAEAAIIAAVADLLHVLGALKGWAPLMAGSALPALIEGLIKLYSLRQPLVSRHTSEVLSSLACASNSHLPPGQLAQLLALLVEGEASAALSGLSIGGSSSQAGGAAAAGDQVAAMARLLEGGLLRLAQAGSSSGKGDAAAAAAAVTDAARLLPRVVHLLVPLLSAEQDGVRYSASAALQSLISSCLAPRVLATMRQQPGRSSGGRGLAPLDSLIAAVAASLGARYQEAWALALPVAGALFEALAAGQAGDAAAQLLAAVGQICAGLSDAAEQREASAMAAMELDGPAAAAAAAAAASGTAAYASAAEAALGAAIRHLGPALVLAELPLQLQQGLDGSGEARTWLLPALRRHVAGAPLCFWAAELLPLTRKMGAAAAAASQRGNKGLAAACHALELQLWASLQSFASWPQDTAAAYAELAPALAAAFHTREDLRPAISSVLVKLCRQARGVALAALQPPQQQQAAQVMPLSALLLKHGASLAALSAAASEGVSQQTRDAIAALELVSAAAAATGQAGSGAGGDDDDDDAHAGAGASDGSDDDDDDDEECRAAAPAGGSHQQQQQRQRQQRGDAEPDDGNGPAHAPRGFTPELALAQLQALRAFSAQWMRLLCKIFIETDAEARGPVGDALSAYASISDKAGVAELYTITLRKYQKVAQDASSPEPPLNPLLEGGSTPDERQASFLELALCLAAGLPDGALQPLFVVCQAHVLGGSSLLQKRAYRALSYLTAARPAWLRANLAAVLELLLLGGPVALSPAKRYRLRCLRPIILLLDTTPCPPLPGLVDAASGAEKAPGGAALAAADDDDDSAAAAAEARRLLLAQSLVGELVLATKEVNKKTRAAAYLLLVELAHELDDARPLTVVSQHGAAAGASGSDDDGMDDEEAGAYGGVSLGRQQQQLAGGLLDFVNAVMAGLVGSSPHMQSAAVLGLARLVFEFAGQLEGLVGRLLPAVLLLLRSASREVIKAVLGFIKVCAMRMPVDLLMVWLPQLMEGMLIWADDSKNKFRLKVRVILERLVRRCGVEAVAEACPPGDAKLLSHIRKQQARKARRRNDGRAGAASEAGGSQADDADFDQRSRRSSAARTARASEWGHTAIFSDEDGGGGGGSEDGRSVAARSLKSRGAASTIAGGRRQQQQQQRRRGLGGGVQLDGDGADPQDLLEPATARQLVKAAAGAGAGAGAAGGVAASSFPAGDDGRLIIRDEDAGGGDRKRKRRGGAEDGGFGGDSDSDMDDMKGFAGLDAAIRSVAGAKSVRFAPSIAASLGNRSLGGASARSGGSHRSGKSGGGRQGGGNDRKQVHSGERYRAKGGATAGDVKGRSSLDPYAYWSFDKKMLNRRRGKQAAAAKGLSGVVAGARAGALKGAKAKRAAQAAKRQRRE